MIRDAENFVMQWAIYGSDKPLLVMGPARTGKTTLVNACAKNIGYRQKIFIDCHAQKEAVKIFSPGLSSSRQADALDAVFGTNIRSGYSLVFLDNIQDAPEVLQYLPALFRESPKLHVIASGRPLKISDEVLDSFKVCHLSSFSFPEFMSECEPELYGKYKNISLEDKSQHAWFLRAYRRYLIIGGMPDCVNEWKESGSIAKVEAIQRELLKTIMDDLDLNGKYCGSRCREILQSIPAQLMTSQQKFSFSLVSDARQARSYHDPLRSLINEGYILPVYSDDDKGGMLPFFFDIGLLKLMSGEEGIPIKEIKNCFFIKPLMQNFIVRSCSEIRLSYSTGKHSRKDFLMDDSHWFRYDVLTGEIPKRKPRKSEDRWIVFHDGEYLNRDERFYLPIYFAPKLSGMLDMFNIKSDLIV